ncbi:hypothetical protein EDB81DRAFT_878710 [Dactylonectria macrodidyma]|uniref:Uncharacterized protein n=1 Tax=Dactylonectria macrodidyma TaxID=307937 RepID=A0A9P9FMF9_9HYPO|nr:hypothetical protein EDB81DRAFT_878710 [Dactylonectria macrodidyma]
MSGDFSQLEWRSSRSSTSVDEDAQPSSTSKLFDENHTLDPNLMDAILGDNSLLGNPTEHDFSKFFEPPWQDSQVPASSTTGLGGLSDISLSLHNLWGDAPAIKASDSDSDLTHCKLSVGMEWFGTIDTSPALSPSTSIDTICNGKAKHTHGDNCQCLSLVASLIEQVETQGGKPDASIDDLLESCSEPLTQCKTLLDCQPCRSRSDLVRLCVQAGKEVSLEVAGPTKDWPGLRVGRHFVDDAAERSIVIEILVAVKLNHLHQFLVDLKTRSETREGPGALILQVEERVRNLKALMADSQHNILSVNTHTKI